MTETTVSKVEKWAYPLKVGGAEATDPQQYYVALAKAKDGYYPLGANGIWHGGVHFDDSTGLVADLAEVRCIADGEVVAYRIDNAYPKSDYGSTQAIYSTGFVLIKHRLEVPSPPAPAPAAGAAPAAATPGPSLTFYSLYMHLLDWAGYTANPTLARPPFWSGGSWQVKAAANDKVLGLRVRQDYRGKSGYATILGVLPRGTVVETGEEINGWLKVVSITPADPNVPAGSGWVYKKEMTPGATPTSYLIGVDSKDEMNPPQKGLAVHSAANQTSPTTAILPAGTEVKIGTDGTPGKYQKLLEVVSGNAIPPLTASNGILGYIWEGLLETKNEPAAKDTVHVLAQPFPVKAGSVIGHVGKYQNHDEAAPKNLLHLEVFSCEDVKAFTEQSKAKAASLPATDRTLVKIPKGSRLITHSQGIDATHPPKASDPGTTTGYDFLIPLGALESLPAEKKIKESVVMNGSTTTTYWWRLEGLLGDEQGNGIGGWFAEPDIALSRHSPYEWQGFEFLEDSVSNVDHLAAYLHDLNQLTDAEKPTFVAKASASTSGPVKERLYSIIDTDKNDRLTVTEIRAALAKPWFAQPISQLVVKYESEWFYKAEKWDALDELMGHTPERPNVGWVAEKKRIEKLAWWGAAGIGSEKVWHVHSVEMIENFTVKLGCINVDQFVAMYADQHVSFQAGSPGLNAESKSNLREVAENINKYVEKTGEVYTIYELSYMFATARHEAYHFTTGEYFSAEPEVGQMSYFNKYDPVLASSDELRRTAIGNGNTVQGDGFKYRGRGLVHLTWKNNYQKATDYFGIDFVNRPDQAAGFANSVPIMIWGMRDGIFTGRKLSSYVNNATKDYEGARKVINGTDQKALIASYARKFEAILKATSVAPETK